MARVAASTDGTQLAESSDRPIMWPAFALAAAISVLTSPLTAIWMLFVAPVVVLAGLWRHKGPAEPSPLLSVGLGLCVGPVLYVGAGLLIYAT